MLLPQSFEDQIKPLLKDEWDIFADALSTEAPVSIRLNPAKGKLFSPKLTNVGWCSIGFYLEKRPSFTFDPLFHAGTYYVQEASSMFVEQAVKQHLEGDVRFLDLCAAPGGKSSHIISLLSPNSLLVSNEVIRSRSEVLAENMTKTGYPNIIVTSNDPSEIGRKMTDYFDAILVDAPCSGEGMFRKDKNAIEEWSPANVQLCKERQQRILADVWAALKPGGLLIYSTCTFNKEENEENILWICDKLGAKTLSVKTNPEWNISPAYQEYDIPCYHFFPHKTKGEGLFLAVLRKDGTITQSISSLNLKSKKGKNSEKKSVLAPEHKAYLRDSDSYHFFAKGNNWFAFPKSLYPDFEYVTSHMYLISAGICMGEYKGKDFIPHQSLALSIALNDTVFQSYEVDKPTAIAYLRKEALSLPDIAKGYILLTFQGIPLGFVKNIGNRANNLYPQDWRIRSGHIPENTENPLL
ncbi:16S rRNA C967 or C1407 C5-methylase (RsmB/RsmF family)/NOL1/NOP2/fmu family ribosome biogenesis protein [Dysgonomonas sp. PH5-45]|uniref:methyltransferase RsmF C-terminal domain-like protein n=1 Tax=unclassified Dysgonomonas TaxID=2630389 RepID=UPI0024741C33|nr:MULTISPECIES: rRNA cytosine-C5-methyltransferase [unclassified Dysgonomonas]MDH6354043.1 16S rRNA C967 or C1407 C5-methylase (RsmB/RsmF family)/NOL1/NOP2/fmu family ribosome biogenesis protein [Dysgonomonas sp. PH5-45]MDH6386945.1 16S rRNA C967 or C1407 C5-methylase (RsmB/RsmF family)/NOL1/NOP2/fmu family ribosome biogenesis protein [Dysgonomonas sp. PH5-37]